MASTIRLRHEHEQDDDRDAPPGTSPAISGAQGGASCGVADLNALSATVSTRDVVRVAGDQRPHVLVPGRDVGQHRERRQRRGRHRQDQLPEDPPAARAVQQRGLLDLAADAEEELAQEEHRERRHQEERRDDAGVGVQPAEVLDQHEVRDQREDRRDHHRRQEEEEHLVPAGEPQPRERVGRHRAEHHLAERDQRADDHRIAQRGEEVDRPTSACRRPRSPRPSEPEHLLEVHQRRPRRQQRLRAVDELRVGATAPCAASRRTGTG